MKMAEAFAEREPKAKKKLHHLRVMKAKGGGHMVEHHFTEEPHMMAEHKPETHVFAKDEGDKLLAHIAKHMGVPGAAEEEGETEHMHMDEPAEVED